MTDVKVVIFFSKGSAWRRLTHFLNFLFLSLLIRSGLEILSAHPELDWMALQPQTLLAYAMNGEPLPIEHGAPLRLRLENQYGFTMVKYIRAIEFVETFRTVGKGRGGWPEDNLGRSREASL